MMSDDKCVDRIAVLESQYSQTIMYRKMRERLESEAGKRQSAELEGLKKDIHEIKQYMGSQKSFIGAIIFIVSGMFSVITVFADKIFN